MGNRNYGFRFDGEPVFAHIQRDVPQPPESDLDHDMFVMGPYTAFDAEYVYDDGEQLENPFIDDPLFDPKNHVTADWHGSFKQALEDICMSFREEFGVRAFLATDVAIPTEQEAGDDEPSMSVLDQSVAFAAVSDATTGVGSEVGAILGEFHL